MSLLSKSFETPPVLYITRSASFHTDNKNAMADTLYSRRVEMKDSASVSETGSDLGDITTQGNKDNILDSGYVEERFRVDRKKLEQMLQGELILIFQRLTDSSNVFKV